MMGPMRWVSLCRLDELVEGKGKYVEIDGFQLAVFLHQAKPYVIDNYCPHAGGNLAAGHVDGTGCAVCPLHDWLFDVKTGSSLNGNCGIKTYTASLEPDGTVTVEVDDGEETMAMPNTGPMTADIATGTPSPG